MREESLVTAAHDCADVSRVCEEECGTWVRSVLFCHQNWFEVIDTLGKCSILASCTQLQFTCQSTLSLRYSLRSVYATVYTTVYATEIAAGARFCGFQLNFQKILTMLSFFENSAQNHKIVRLPALRERRLWRRLSVDCSVD